MGYYMGDYYRGDYYRGDFFGWAGKILKGGLKLGGKLLGIGGGATKVIAPIAPVSQSTRAIEIAQRAGGRVVKMAKAHPVLTGAGAAGAAGGLGAMIGRRGRGAAPGMPGMRRHKRMNVCNPRALRRAIRRTHGFAKLAMRTIHLVHPKKKARFGGFRRKRARK
jgi:hypothetical protein